MYDHIQVEGSHMFSFSSHILCLQDFFETCAMLITVVILGKYLECAAKGKTSAAIQALMALAPDTATLVELDDDEHVISEDTVHSSLIHHGDLLKVCSEYKLIRAGV